MNNINPIQIYNLLQSPLPGPEGLETHSPQTVVHVVINAFMDVYHRWMYTRDVANSMRSGPTKTEHASPKQERPRAGREQGEGITVMYVVER